MQKINGVLYVRKNFLNEFDKKHTPPRLIGTPLFFRGEFCKSPLVPPDKCHSHESGNPVEIRDCGFPIPDISGKKKGMNIKMKKGNKMLKSMINPDLSGKTRLTKGIILLLGMSLFLNSLIFAGPNENAGIVFDLDATTYGNQNLTGIPSQPAGTYIRLDVYCTGVHNFDTYEFGIIYDPTELAYVAASATNPITFEPNILTTNGGTALGWMINTSTPGVLSIAYTLAYTDTLEAPEGEGLIADIVFQALVATHGTLSFGDVHFYDSFGVMDIITDKGIAILYQFGNIDGTVTNSDTGEPIEDAIVSISDFSDTTGTDGTYLLEYVHIGIYDITCTAEGYYDTVDVVEVLEDQTVTVDFVLETLPRGTLDGTVTDANNGEPIEDALITATSQGKVEYTGFTNADGYYIIDSLLASEIVGSYIVTCEAGVPYTSGEVTDVEIIEDETTTIDFALAAPIMVVSPLEIFPVVENMGDSTIIDITVSNIGTAPFDWDTDIENPDAITLDFTTNRFEGVTAPSMNAEVYPNQTNPYNPPTKDMWDLLFSYDVDTPSGLTGLAGAEFGNGYFYVTKWAGAAIVKFDIEGNWIENFTIPGVSGLRDLAFDGEYFYGGAAAYTIYKMDFDAHTLVGTISSPVVVRSIAYDSDNDAFWVNNWAEDLKLIDRSGNVLNTISAPPSMYGSAYDNISDGGPYLWIFTGTSSGGGCQVEQYDLNTLTLTGVIHSVSGDFPGTVAGGLFTSGDIVPGTWVLGGLAQRTPDILFGYELPLPWITVEPTSGTIEPGGDEIVQATVYWLESFFPGQVKYADIVFTPNPNCGEQTVNVQATFGPDIPGSISGLVTLENTPYSSGNVEDVLLTGVSQVFPSIYYNAYPDSTGEYIIEGIYHGTYDVTATLENYEDATIEGVVVLENQNTPNIDFEMNCLLGALQGTVTDGWGVPIEGAVVTATSVGDVEYQDTTNSDGYYIIPEIQEDTYNVSCFAAGYNIPATQTAVIVGDETTTVNFNLTQPTMDITPTSISETVPPNEPLAIDIHIVNNGDGELAWDASIIMPDRGVETDYSNCTTGILEAKNGQANGGNGSNGFVAEENLKDDITLHYDGPNDDAIGLTNGGTFMVAARFTPTELGDYYGDYQLSNVEIFIYDMPTSATLKVWEGGSMGDPGTEIYSEDITGQISPGSWNSIILSAPIDLVSDNEYWVGYEVTHNAGLYPAGCDAGPAVDEKGDWIYLAPGPWDELQNVAPTLDYNWNIRAVLSPRITPWWITLTHNSGIVAAGGDSTVTVYFNTIDHTIGDTLQATIDFVSTPDVGTTSIPVTITVGDIGVTGEPEILVTELYGNFPNPFSSSTVIKFSLKEATYVKLSVYNIRGQLVKRLIDQDMVAGADYQVKWDGTSKDKKFANGIYFYKLEISNKTFLKKMILMR